MTYKELTRDVISLCRDMEIKSRRLMVNSVNSALREIYARRRIIRKVKLYAFGLTPSLYRKQIFCKGGSSVRIPLSGAAYSMRLCGEGIYRIEDGDKTEIVQFNTDGGIKLVRGLIKNGGSIYFYGNASFMVFDMSVYDDLVSNLLTDLPETRQNQIFDIRRSHGDFLSFIEPPRDIDGRIIPGYRLYDGKLEIPISYRGEINLSYRALPPKVVITTDEYIEAEEREKAESEGKPYIPPEEDLDLIEVDIPEEYTHALALLSAYYYKVAENSATAQGFKADYERVLKGLDECGYEELDSSYHLEIGWA
jgi:hypothetical protein